MKASRAHHAAPVVRSSALTRSLPLVLPCGLHFVQSAPSTPVLRWSGGPLPTPRRTAAFATVLALLIIALLVVVLVGGAMVLRLETFTSSNAQKIAEARQNALYGLETAIADLQELAGPDQRVTATAELNRDPASALWEPSFLTGGNATTKPTTPSRNWTGVWDVSKNRYIPDTTTPGRVVSNVGSGTTQVSPKPLKWLVSGGQRKSGGTESQTNNVTPAAYPARIAGNGTITGAASSEDHVILLGSGTVDLSASPEDGVVVPKVPIFNPSSPRPANPSGSYAYWVGDEGVKAKFQAGAETKAFDDTFSGSERDILRLSAPQKLGIGAVTGNATGTLLGDGYDPSNTDFLDALRRLSADTQIGYLPDGDKLGPDFKRRFHDLTLHSQGVLSDVKKGGLKQDLTVYLQQGNIAGKIRDAGLLYEDSRDDSSVTDPTNPRAPFRVRFPGFHPTSNNGLPRIGLLRSWYNLTTPTVRPQTETQHGMFPVITRCEWPAWLHMNLNLAGATYPFAIPANAFELRIYPTITLYNPYNVDLPGQDYTVTIPIGGNATFEIRKSTVGTPPNETENDNTTGDPTLFNISAALGGANEMVFTIPAAESAIGPGESRIFTLGTSGGAYSSGMGMIADYVTETNGFGSQATAAVDPNGDNQNGYFAVPATIAAIPLQIKTNAGSLRFRYELYRTSGTANSREVRLSSNGNLLQRITESPFENAYSWLPTDFKGNYELRFTSINYSGLNARSIDTRKPAACFHRRPVVHACRDTAGNIEGGNLLPVVFGNLRAPTDTPVPAIWDRSTGPNPTALHKTRYWGAWRNLPDGPGNQAKTISARSYSPPILSGLASEIFPLTHTDPLSGFNSPIRVSASFSSSQLRSAPLFALRTQAASALSLADFQHANIAQQSWQPSYVVGNSYVPPNIKGRDCYAGFYNYTWTSGGTASLYQYFQAVSPVVATSSLDTENRVYDASFMANDALWDRFFLSGADTTSPRPAALLANTESLPNARLQFRQSEGVDYNSLGTPAEKFERGSAFLACDGMFNVNSTSVEAWKALLSSRIGLKINNSTAGATETVFARMANPGAGAGGFFGLPSNPRQPGAELSGAYTGARKLSSDEIQVLAEEIVEQVRECGPFTSVSDFVNRRLTTELAAAPYTETNISRTGLTGPLQSAIDAASDRLGSDGGGINSFFYDASIPGSHYKPEKIRMFHVNPAPADIVKTPDNTLRGAVVPRLAMLGRDWYYSAAGVPGFITQADVLQAIGPLLTARSDTFRIRSYGEVKSPKTGKIESRAWCEAIVQRLPDPLKDAPTADDIIWPERPAAATNPANAAGRKFKVIAFRWLTPEEV